jgi:hypothetical protein
MKLRSALMLTLVSLAAACVADRQPPASLVSPFKPITLTDLRITPEKLLHEKVTFSATIDRVEETSGGTWLYLKDRDERVTLYTSMSFGGSMRTSLNPEDRMQFDVEVGGRKLTSLGTYAVEVLPYQISKTTYFDQAIPMEPPKPE